MAIRIPERLRALLASGRGEAVTLTFVDAIGTILADNKTPFFPDYTDHGTEHVERVLDAAVALIPDRAWDLLTPEDAASLIAAVCLHDIGMHVREGGFLELVAPHTRFRAVAWFADRHGQRSPDQPWHDLWHGFRREVRQWTESDLDRLLGAGHGGTPAIAFGDHDARPERWVTADRLVVGEFVRRHHARLAHEIALHGFPGADDAHFPVLGGTVRALADAAGAIARSHGEPLRTGLSYASYRHAGTKQPWGVYAGYLMGLLRIADYFQLDTPRAPVLLLHLKQPQSPVSIDEWQKHSAVDRLSWHNDDRFAINVQTNADHSLRTHLQLTDLLDGLQRELDTTTAVLSETYGTGDLASLELRARRVTTNLFDSGIRDELPYVPRRARLRSAEDLFRLVIGDLYGDFPEVAGRELVQNAVDAVRERRLWELDNGTLPDGELRDLPADVLVEVFQERDGSGLLRVSDRGVGMTSDTLIDHFMSAGASFRPSRAGGVRRDAAPIAAAMKAGRFGVGAFSAFLLGDEMRVTTRSPSSRKGFACTLRMHEDLVEVARLDDVPVGTVVEVPFASLASRSGMELATAVTSFYRLADPTIAYRWRADGGACQTLVPHGDRVPTPEGPLPDDWRLVPESGLDAVAWRATQPIALLTHNGISVGRPGRGPLSDIGPEASPLWWTSREHDLLLAMPQLALFDGAERFGLSLTRYAAAERTLAFEAQLLESIGRDLVARALVTDRPHPLARAFAFVPVYGADAWWPMWPGIGSPSRLCVTWDRFKASDTSALDDLAAVDRTAFPLVAKLKVMFQDRDATLVDDVWGSVEDLAQLGWRGLTTAVATRTARSPSVPESYGGRRLEVMRNHATWTVSEVEGGGTRADAVQLSEAVRLAAEVAAVREDGFGAVTLFEWAGWSGEPDEVACTWHDLLGEQGIPQDDRERAALAARVAASDREMARLIDGWRRLTSTAT